METVIPTLWVNLADLCINQVKIIQLKSQCHSECFKHLCFRFKGVHRVQPFPLDNGNEGSEDEIVAWCNRKVKNDVIQKWFPLESSLSRFVGTISGSKLTSFKEHGSRHKWRSKWYLAVLIHTFHIEASSIRPFQPHYKNNYGQIII